MGADEFGYEAHCLRPGTFPLQNRTIIAFPLSDCQGNHGHGRVSF
jgi:hypothetical protein